MALLLLVIIYVVFISLGLPDGVLGSAWPKIYPSLAVPAGVGGVVALVSTTMSILSSLSTSRLVRKLGTPWLLAASTGLTVAGLLGYAQASNLWWLLAFAVPLGLGAGAIDAAINHYVATHYEAHHMNWLHACWGVGATLGPVIFAASLGRTGDWHTGFGTIGLIQAGIVAVLLVSVPLWAKVHERHKLEAQDEAPVETKFRELLREGDVRLVFTAFLLYVGIEVGIGLWLASYLVAVQHTSVATAALWTGSYYGAITAGRVLMGFASMKIGTSQLLRYGLIGALAGVVMLVSNTGPVVSLVGLVLIGLGFAPVYPGMIHETPRRFGRTRSAKVISLQMVGGAVGATTVPPLIGLLVNTWSLVIFAWVVVLAVVALFVVTEIGQRRFT